MQRKHIAVTLAFVGVACAGGGAQVRTLSAPDLTITGRNTFAFLAVPHPSDGTALDAADPMLDGSVASRALREELRQPLEARGYRAVDGSAPDMTIALYAAASQPTDIHRFDYGYASRPSSEASPRGTVIVDLVDPASHRLLWRGEGVAPPSNDPNRQLAAMESVLDAIAAKLPRAIP